MASITFSDNASMQDIGAQGITAFYLTIHDNCSPQPKFDFHDLQHVMFTPLGREKEEEALKVDFDALCTLDQPQLLITFGSDPSCNVQLLPQYAERFHCKVYAQLNSGSNILLLKDTSTNGTGTIYVDDKSKISGTNKIIRSRCRAIHGLHYIEIGPYKFRCFPPSERLDIDDRKAWFKRHEPLLVTGTMLRSQLGKRIKPKYTFQEKLGAGGQGTVDKVMERTTGLMVAVKTLKIERLDWEDDIDIDDTVAMKQILHEVDNMKKLKHHHMVRYIHSERGKVDGRPVYHVIMPLFRASLQSVLDKISFAEQTTIIKQVNNAVNYMHQQYFVHNDIKPDNIFVRGLRPATVVLGDMGLATMFGSSERGGGTRGFMAPECRSRQYSTASDIYSLGATYFAIFDWLRVKNVDIKALPVIDIKGRKQPPVQYCIERLASEPASEFPNLIERMLAIHCGDRPFLEEVQYAIGMTIDCTRLEPRPGPLFSNANVQNNTNGAEPTAVEPISNTLGHPDVSFSSSTTSIIPFVPNATPAQENTVSGATTTKDDSLSAQDLIQGSIFGPQTSTEDNISPCPYAEDTLLPHPDTQDNQPTTVIAPTTRIPNLSTDQNAKNGNELTSDLNAKRNIPRTKANTPKLNPPQNLDVISEEPPVRTETRAVELQKLPVLNEDQQSFTEDAPVEQTKEPVDNAIEGTNESVDNAVERTNESVDNANAAPVRSNEPADFTKPTRTQDAAKNPKLSKPAQPQPPQKAAANTPVAETIPKTIPGDYHSQVASVLQADKDRKVARPNSGAKRANGVVKNTNGNANTGRAAHNAARQQKTRANALAGMMGDIVCGVGNGVLNVVCRAVEGCAVAWSIKAEI